MKLAYHLALAASFTTLAISATVPCGEKVCNAFEYCSEDAFCTSCQGVCQFSSHNYDDFTCKTKCPGYLNSLYVSREDFEAAVNRVNTYVLVSLVISILVLLLVLSVFLVVWLKYQRMRCYNDKNMKKKFESIKAVCVNEVDGTKKLKLEMPVAVPAPVSAMTTLTPLSTRHPSEDTTLEYAAYDNPTLTHSPVFSKNQQPISANTTPKIPRTETSF